MRCLLDTNVLIWFLASDERLPVALREDIADPRNDVFVSIASLWEVGIKCQLGKLELKRSYPAFLKDIIASDDFKLLAISPAHLEFLYALPFKHRDPFDRLLFAQSQVEKLKLIYTDSAFALYLP